MNWDQVLEHYARADVRREIAEYCRDRWVAVHCEETDDRGLQLMIRYWRRGKPLTIRSEGDVQSILRRFSKLKPRSFYATAHIYMKLTSVENILDRRNIVASAPTWDIDSKDGDWRKVVAKAREIIEILEKHGVSRSVFFKWSGRGAHVHVNPLAFSEEIRKKMDPLDIAYSVSQYVVNRVEPLEGVVVENKLDVQRVFTAPLSLHRKVDRVAVCLPPNMLDDFTIEWTDPRSYRHYPDSWRRYEVGEGDELAEKAFFAIGPYIEGRRRRRKHKPLDQEILETLRKFDDEL
ncbi:MAG: hypothetical protein J7J94_00075 [Thaumarchaeota archaeon]|nr:hypothetical protein [Nitrososphaerota archaeon]